MHTYFESIYRYVYVVARSELKTELAAYMGLKMFFCHAHCPRERATCESRNDRIRHYLLKDTNLPLIPHQQLSAYQKMINRKSPDGCFQALIVSSQPST